MIDDLPAAVDGELADGTPIRFRPIRPTDKELLARGFDMLSPMSRYLRFFRAIDHLSESQLHYLTEVDFENHFAWVAVIPGRRVDGDGEFGVGVGRWIRLKDDPHEAEAAITVIDDYQHRGIGTALLWLLARTALERGIERFKTYTLGQNETVRAMMSELGGRAGHWESGILELDVDLPDTVEELEGRYLPAVIAAGRGSSR